MSYWRPVLISDTSADTDGIKYIDVANDREMLIYGFRVTYERDSDITYTSNLTPVVDIVKSTSVTHTAQADEQIVYRFTPVTALLTSTTPQSVQYLPCPPPGGDTGFGGSYLTTDAYHVQIPRGLVLSTEFRIKFWTSPSTGGDLLQEIHLHAGMGDNKGRRA